MNDIGGGEQMFEIPEPFLLRQSRVPGQYLEHTRIRSLVPVGCLGRRGGKVGAWLGKRMG